MDTTAAPIVDSEYAIGLIRRAVGLAKTMTLEYVSLAADLAPHIAAEGKVGVAERVEHQVREITEMLNLIAEALPDAYAAKD